VLSLTEKKISKAEQRKLNQQLDEMVTVFIERSQKSALNEHNFEKVRNLINEGAKCKITNEFVETLFNHKFLKSCKNAKMRTEEREDYKRKNVQYLLGDRDTAFQRLKEERPDLYKEGFQIVKDYLEESMKNGKMAYWKALSIHRTNDSGNYDWENIQFLPVKQHQELTSKPQQVITFRDNSIQFSSFPSIRALAEHLQVSEKTIYSRKNMAGLIENNQLAGICYWFDGKAIKSMKKHLKKELEILAKENKSDDYGKKIWKSFLYEILLGIGSYYGFFDEEITERKKPLDYLYEK
jgi:hypothetical protein